MVRRRGIVFLSALFTMVILIMFTGALIQVSHQDLASGAHHRDRVRALEMARGGVNHALHRLTYEPAFTGDLQGQDQDCSYQVGFDPALPVGQRSTNQLTGMELSPLPGASGRPVYPGTVEIVARARAGKVGLRLCVTACRGLQFDRSVGTSRQVHVNGPRVEMDGIESLAHPVASGGGIFSESGGPGAVTFSGATSQTMSAASRIEVPGGSGSVSGLNPAFASQVVQPGSRPATIPEFDVTRMVSHGSAAPPPAELRGAGGGYSLPSSNIASDRYVPGDLTVNGDLRLSGGTLYVNGRLTVNGGISGSGSVFADGDVGVHGGTSLLNTNQSSGAALFSSGSVQMDGQNAAGYLQSLASTFPGSDIGSSFSDYRTGWDNFAITTLTPLNTRMQVQNSRINLAALVGSSHTMADPSNYWVQPVPAPDGTRSSGNGDRPIPRLTRAIKSALGAAYASDRRAQSIVRGLEEEAFVGRGGYFVSDVRGDEILPDYKASGVASLGLGSPRTRNGQWDDASLVTGLNPSQLTVWTDLDVLRIGDRVTDLSFDHQMRGMTGSVDLNPFTDPDQPLPAYPGLAGQTYSEMVARTRDQYKSLAVNHPSDLSWLSRGKFQGLVYAGGGVTISGDFKVVGGVVARGDVYLNGNSALVYNREYFKQRGSIGPLMVTSVQEL